MGYFIRCNHCKEEFPEKLKKRPLAEKPCPSCGEEEWARELFRNDYTFVKAGVKKKLKLCSYEYEAQIQDLYDDGWTQSGVLGFPPSVVRNKGRKVDGILGEQLRSIDKAYGKKSNIRGSVDLSTWT